MTELVFILDRSGSMHGMEKDTIGGFNGMLEQQKAQPGEALVSTVLFSNESQVVYDRVPLKNISPMTEEQYRPMGCTALLDAIGGAVHHIGNVHKYAREEDRPEHTLFVITTDGMENASRHYTAERVKQMIRHQKEHYSWEFLFLTANIDAVQTAGGFGIAPERAAQFHNDAAGTRVSYEAVNQAICNMRANRPLSGDWKAKIDADYQQRK